MQSSTTTFFVAVLAAALFAASPVADAAHQACIVYSDDEVVCEGLENCQFLPGPELCVDADLTCDEVTKEAYEDAANNICNHLEYPGGEDMCKWKSSKDFCKTLQNPDPADCSEIVGKSKCRHADEKYNLTDGCYWNPEEETCGEVPEACDMVFDKTRCNKAQKRLGIEDNCAWDNDAKTCGIPMACSDLSKGKCMKYDEYPKVVETDGECEYIKEAKGCFKKE